MKGREGREGFRGENGKRKGAERAGNNGGGEKGSPPNQRAISASGCRVEPRPKIEFGAFGCQ